MEYTTQALLIVSQLAMGLSLAACAGLRAFLPLFVVGLAGRLEWIPLTPSFDWLSSTPALVVFGVAVAAELVADKTPWFDHFLDAFQVFVKPVAGMIVVAAALHDLMPLQTAVLALVLGGGTAGAVHLSKAQLRLVSSATTGGLANPVISTVEEGGAWTLAAAAIWIPMVTAVVFLSGIVVLILAARRRRSRTAIPRPV